MVEYGMEQPNIFDYATSELSQDAFICYLLAFGMDKYKKAYPREFKIAHLFLKKCGIPADEEILEIRKQYATELYNEYGVKKTVEIPTNCNDFITLFKSVDGEVYFSKKKVKSYNLADTFALAGGLATCQHYSVNDEFNQEVTV